MNVMEKTVAATTRRVALVGNPNSGKSTLFNLLTGLNQRTGNFPGVTVDKKSGKSKIQDPDTGRTYSFDFIDLPGTYSLYPKSLDEQVAFNVLCDDDHDQKPEQVIIVADASNLKRSLFLASQIIDLQIPAILVLNMIDQVEEKGLFINTQKLSEKIGIPVVSMNSRKSLGLAQLKTLLTRKQPVAGKTLDLPPLQSDPSVVTETAAIIKSDTLYKANLALHNLSDFPMKEDQRSRIKALVNEKGFDSRRLQSIETVSRYEAISMILIDCIEARLVKIKNSLTVKLDRVLTHKTWGYVIFLTILFLMFQSIFFLASYPMEWIEMLFGEISGFVRTALPDGKVTDLLVDGIIAGLSGVLLFVPQIALLFAFIAVLEDSGYMARVSFIMDKLMRKIGLNGRSVIPLISGVACAVPAIMSTRTISNWKERMITIMVTPLMSCSARLPVYALLISLVVPKETILGFFNLQGLVLMGLYLLGFVAALGSAVIFNFFIKAREKSFFIMELPVYRAPKLSTISLTIFEKVKVFILDAGKIIIAISIILWMLSSHAPGNRFEAIDKKYSSIPASEEMATAKSLEKLEASYAGIIGKTMEPAIEPLGFDWKIGISLVTSFAAREAFVGTMATIYSVGDQDDSETIREKMADATNAKTGEKIYTAATGISLMVFYAFALQCMSTLAVVRRETGSWKWPLIQFLYLSVLAWISSAIVYNIFS